MSTPARSHAGCRACAAVPYDLAIRLVTVARLFDALHFGASAVGPGWDVSVACEAVPLDVARDVAAEIEALALGSTAPLKDRLRALHESMGEPFEGQQTAPPYRVTVTRHEDPTTGRATVSVTAHRSERTDAPRPR